MHAPAMANAVPHPEYHDDVLLRSVILYFFSFLSISLRQYEGSHSKVDANNLRRRLSIFWVSTRSAYQRHYVSISRNLYTLLARKMTAFASTFDCFNFKRHLWKLFESEKKNNTKNKTTLADRIHNSCLSVLCWSRAPFPPQKKSQGQGQGQSQSHSQVSEFSLLEFSLKGWSCLLAGEFPPFFHYYHPSLLVRVAAVVYSSPPPPPPQS